MARPRGAAVIINDRPDIAEGLANVYLKYKAAKVPARANVPAARRNRPLALSLWTQMGARGRVVFVDFSQSVVC